MCGVFGAVLGQASPLLGREALRHVRLLFNLSASRGKEAAGLAVAAQDELLIYKQPVPARTLIREPELRRMIVDELQPGRGAIAFIGHSRLVTDGGRDDNANNQPVVGNGIAGIHNGIIVNHEALWAAHPDLARRHEVDSEVIFALIRSYLDRGQAMQDAVSTTFAELRGAASIAALFADRQQLLLATNNGSLYYHQRGDTVVFASERYILDRYLDESGLGAGEVLAVGTGHGLLVDLETRKVTLFPFGPSSAERGPVRATPRKIVERSPILAPVRRPADPTPRIEAMKASHPYQSTTDVLKRCTRCVLPSTMPFIEFDAAGVCSYCRNYKGMPMHGPEALAKLVEPHRRTDGRPDCVVAVSGGRDSMYGLHYIKAVLGMNPVAFTYDWGMVTDLARRNVSRICGQLGIEHILVSADIDKKRSYIRKNVEAWLKRPTLGTIPLFMAGDKAYFHYLDQVRKQAGVELAFLCENPLERTDFKSGFAGVPPVVRDDTWVAMIPLSSKVKLATYYMRQFLRNPAYLNSSMVDSAFAFFYYYFKREYHNLYSYVRWEENEVARTLIDTYNFELAPDTTSTWRIGDGTAAFYNYIYHRVAGFTEHDTLRSNQLREGVLTRPQAMALIERDNRPRFASMQWYLEDALNIDGGLERVIEIVDRIPRMYELDAAPAPAKKSA
jgi:predicted glutamine amidotransferase